MQLDLGRLAYLSVVLFDPNDNAVMTYQKLSLPSAAEVSLPDLQIYGYDGGNNILTNDELRTIEVTSSTGLKFSGSTNLNMVNAALRIMTGTFKLLAPTWGEHIIRFETCGVLFTEQVVEILPGVEGASLRMTAPAVASYPSAATVTVDPFTIEVLDSAGNALGTYDRYAGIAVDRTLVVSSATLTLQNANHDTVRTGKATVSNLQFVAPVIGNHTLTVTDSFQSLTEGSMVIEVVAGAASFLGLQSAVPGVYSASFPRVPIASSLLYAEEDLMPLAQYDIEAKDAGGNRVSVLPTYLRYSTEVLSNETFTDVYDIVTANLIPPPPPSSAFFDPFATTVLLITQEELDTMDGKNETVFQGDSTVVLVDHEDTLSNKLSQFENTVTTVSSTGVEATVTRIVVTYNITESTIFKHKVTVSAAAAAVTGSDYLIGNNLLATPSTTLETVASAGGKLSQDLVLGQASFPGLALRKPRVGTYSIKVTNSDVSIAALESQITVTEGAPHHLGLQRPCTTSVTADCTTTTYTASSLTPLENITVLVLDGGDNPVGSKDATGPHPVTVSVVGGTVTLSGTTMQNTVDGVAKFTGLHFVAPVEGTNTLKFTAPGLNPVTVNVLVIAGSAYSLRVEPSNKFPENVANKLSYPSTVETLLSTIDAPIVVRVLDGGSNKISTATEFETLVYVSCATADIVVGDGSTNYTITEKGLAYFHDLKLIRPVAAKHTLHFTSPTVIGDAYEIGVVIGPAIGLRIRNYTPQVYQGAVTTPLVPLDVFLVDAGDNNLGSLNPSPRRITVNIAGPQHEFFTDEDQNQQILQTGKGTVTFNDLVIGGGRIGNYNITVSSNQLVSDYAGFEVTVGPAYGLHVPEQWTAANNKEYTLIQEYYSSRALLLRPVPIIVVDGGGNFIGNLDTNADGLNLRRQVKVTVNEGELTSDTKYTTAGQTVMDTIVLKNPASRKAGKRYILTFRTTTPSVLAPYNVDVIVKVGYPSQIEVMPFDLRTTYSAAANTTLNRVEARLLDAGGSWVENAYPEERNMTVALEYVVEAATGAKITFNATNSTLESHQADASLETKVGRALWCTYDADQWREDRGPDGVRDDACSESYLGFLLPKAGKYGLIFESTCTKIRCPGVFGRDSYMDMLPYKLEITIVPGKPAALVFTTPPSRYTEHNFVMKPAPALQALDVAGNLCTGENTFITVRFEPRMILVFGNIAPMIAGVSTFSNLQFLGRRGTSYTLQFGAPSLGLTTDYPGVQIIECEAVKPNSQPDGFGGCECVPGYTEDLHTTGYSDTKENPATATFDGLYKEVVHDDMAWFGALNPYGLCVPCGNGFYKPEPGPQECTRCPDRFDTAFANGTLIETRVTLSKKTVQGSLGNHRKEACHCIVQPAPPFDSYFRNMTEKQQFVYKCEPCPDGGVCDGQGHRMIEAAPGFYRTNRESILFHECPNPDACLGGLDSVCQIGNGTGYAGPLCAKCADGYAYPTVGGRFPPQCDQCPAAGISTLVNLFQVAAFLLVYVVIYSYNNRTSSDSVMLLKTYVCYLQTLAVMRHLDLKWPVGIGSLFAAAEKVSSPELKSFYIDCIFGWSLYEYVGIYLAIPPVAVFVSGTYYLFANAKELRNASATEYKRRMEAQEAATVQRNKAPGEGDLESGEGNPLGDGKLEIQAAPPPPPGASKGDFAGVQDKATAGTLILIFLTLPTIARNLGMLFPRKVLTDSHPDHNEVGYVFLRHAMEIQCGGDHIGWMFAGVMFTAFYLIVVPTLWAMNVRLSDRSNRSTHFRYGFLYKGFYDGAWWWEFLNIFRRYVLVFISVFLEHYPILSAHLTSWVLEVALLLHFIVGPYENQRQNRLELGSLLLSLLTVHLGILFQGGIGSSTLVDFFGLLVYVVNGAYFIVFVRSVYHELRKESKHDMLKRAHQDLRKEEGIRKQQLKQDFRGIEVKKLNPRKAGALQTSFADDTLLDTVAKEEVPDLRLKHLQLSVGLENLRSHWRGTKKKGLERLKQSSIEDLARERKREQVPAERWRQKKAAMQPIDENLGAALEGEPGAKPGWKEQMKDSEWRTAQRLKYRVQERLKDEDTRSEGTVSRRFGRSDDGGSEAPMSARSGSSAGGATTDRSGGESRGSGRRSNP